MSDSKFAHTGSQVDVAINGDYIEYLKKELAEARKFEEVGMLASVVAHDLNNVLTPIFGYSTILRRDMESDHPLSKAVGVIEKSAERASVLIGRLLGCARQNAPVAVSLDLSAILDESLASIQFNGITINKSYPDLPSVHADPHHVAIVVKSVICNSIEAMPEGGTLSVTASPVEIDAGFCRNHSPLKPGLHVCLKISDTGTGIPEDLMPRVFEPFFSTKSPEACAGVGLTVAQSLIKRNAGALVLESHEGRGTTVSVYLPVVSSTD